MGKIGQKLKEANINFGKDQNKDKALERILKIKEFIGTRSETEKKSWTDKIDKLMKENNISQQEIERYGAKKQSLANMRKFKTKDLKQKLLLQKKRIRRKQYHNLTGTKITRAGLFVGGALIIGGGIADAFLSEHKKKESKKLERRQKRQKANERKQKESLNDTSRTAAYYDMMQFNSYVQTLYTQRSGSRNTYGGRRY